MAELSEAPETNEDVAYEPSDWRIGAIALTLLGIFMFLVIAPLVLIVAYPGAVSDVSRKLTTIPPAPRLQTNPAQDLASFEAEQQKRLSSYYWIDKQKGVVHIPIEEAMKELAKKGIDGFPKGSE
jgi:hypothetical protein